MGQNTFTAKQAGQKLKKEKFLTFLFLLLMVFAESDGAAVVHVDARLVGGDPAAGVPDLHVVRAHVTSVRRRQDQVQRPCGSDVRVAGVTSELRE